MSLNKIVIMGRMTHDPELKTTPGGTSVTSFCLAVDRDYKTKDGEKQTDFIHCTAWRNTAEFVSRYFTKGSMAVAAGSLQSRQYEKDGEKRTVWEVLVDKVYFAESNKSDSKGSAPSQQQDLTPVPYSNGTPDDFQVIGEDDDLPF